MASNVAGMDIPEPVLKRMGGVPKEKAREEGLKICLETISELRQTDGVRGVHIMAIESEEMVPEIIEAAGLLPRPQSVIPGGSHA
jgi:methylenetetrahydrofolate reductase (NADPH)